MGERDLKNKELKKLKLFECDGCGGEIVCLEFPGGWLQFYKYSEDQGKTYYTGDWYCPECRKERE